MFSFLYIIDIVITHNYLSCIYLIMYYFVSVSIVVVVLHFKNFNFFTIWLNHILSQFSAYSLIFKSSTANINIGRNQTLAIQMTDPIINQPTIHSFNLRKMVDTVEFSIGANKLSSKTFNLFSTLTCNLANTHQKETFSGKKNKMKSF